MKSKLDILLILGMALCYALGHVVAADAFSAIALALFLVFVIRLAGGTITWLLTGL
jgi:hypothetical protein